MILCLYFYSLQWFYTELVYERERVLDGGRKQCWMKSTEIKKNYVLDRNAANNTFAELSNRETDRERKREIECWFGEQTNKHKR